jgi:hypothetical protein
LFRFHVSRPGSSRSVGETRAVDGGEMRNRMAYGPGTGSLLSERAPDPLSYEPLARPRYEVVFDGAGGSPLLAFSDGQWYDVSGGSPRPVSLRRALRRDPAWAGAVVQAVCLWMRRHPGDERSFELATELALAVAELVRQQIPR